MITKNNVFDKYLTKGNIISFNMQFNFWTIPIITAEDYQKSRKRKLTKWYHNKYVEIYSIKSCEFETISDGCSF